MTPKIAVFDFDGTITSIDSAKFLIFALLTVRPYKIFRILGLLFKLKLSSETELIQIYKNRIFGILLEGLRDDGRALDSYKKHIQKTLRKKVVDHIEALIKNDVKVVVLTASPQDFVKKVFEEYDVDVMGAIFQKEKSKYRRALIDPCFGKYKVQRLMQYKVDGFELSEGWSDSLVDLPFMKLMSKRCWCAVSDSQEINFIRNDPGGSIVRF